MLYESKKEVDDISEKLDTAEKQLVASQESVKDLTTCVDHLLMTDRRNEKGAVNWQAVYKSLSAKIDDTMIEKSRLLEAFNAKVDKVKLIRREAEENADELHSTIAHLKANLDALEAKEVAQRAKIAQLEKSRKPFSLWPSRSTWILPVMNSFQDTDEYTEYSDEYSDRYSDQCSSLNRNPGVNNQRPDHGKDESTATEIDHDEFDLSYFNFYV